MEIAFYVLININMKITLDIFRIWNLFTKRQHAPMHLFLCFAIFQGKKYISKIFFVRYD